MTRWGVIADVHGNAQALTAALAALDEARVDKIVCLGDVVGYNAAPDACAATLVDRGIDAIAGNHDLIAIGRLGFERCATKPAFALRNTRRRLRPGTRAYLADLPAWRRYPGGIVLVHGAVDDVQEYVRTDAALVATAARLRELDPGARLCCFGHTHERLIAEVSGRDVRRIDVPDDGAPLALPPARDDAIVFVNPGSVDAARRDDKRAELAVLDLDARTVRWLRVPYDDAGAEADARRAGYRMSAVAQALLRARRELGRAARLVRDRSGAA